MGAQRRSTQSNSLHVGRSEADRRAMPPDEYRSEGTPSLSEGPYVGARPLVPLGRLPKGLAVGAKPPAAVTAATDMYSINQEPGRPKGRQGQSRSNTPNNPLPMHLPQQRQPTHQKPRIPTIPASTANPCNCSCPVNSGNSRIRSNNRHANGLNSENLTLQSSARRTSNKVG